MLLFTWLHTDDAGNKKVMYFLDLVVLQRSEFKLTIVESTHPLDINEYRSGHLKAYRPATSCDTRSRDSKGGTLTNVS